MHCSHDHRERQVKKLKAVKGVGTASMTSLQEQQLFHACTTDLL
jgi:hypothetical protein